MYTHSSGCPANNCNPAATPHNTTYRSRPRANARCPKANTSGIQAITCNWFNKMMCCKLTDPTPNATPARTAPQRPAPKATRQNSHIPNPAKAIWAATTTSRAIEVDDSTQNGRLPGYSTPCWRLAKNGSPPYWLSSQVGTNPLPSNPASPCFSGPKNPNNTSSKKVWPRTRIASKNGTVSNPSAR